MRVYKLPKKNLIEFLESVSHYGELWGPVKKGNHYIYEKIEDLSKLETRPVIPLFSLKKFVHPPKIDLFTKRESYETGLDKIPKRIVFGAPPCDIHGLLILDKIFMENYPDPYYIERRKKTIILGVSCVPKEECLCRSTNTHIVEEGFDLFFTDLEDFYLVWVGSSIGDDLLREREELFDANVTQEDIKKFSEWQRWRESQCKVEVDFAGIQDIMALSYESPIWEELGEKCLVCGSCTMVCPTCNCYDIRDTIDIKDRAVTRERFWDACTLKYYSMVAGGHNFRESRADRLKLWYTHKLQAFGGEFGKPSCVGCGRCVIFCPVDINVVTVIKKLRGES